MLQGVRGDFWSHVDVRGPEECWPWLASRRPTGYGAVNRGGTMTKAHRVAFEKAYGYWPEVVRHRCDNPPCCNPNHLQAGTHADNVRDMHERGRYAGDRRQFARGESHGMAKLTHRKVDTMRALFGVGRFTRMELAQIYDVSYEHVCKIIKGRHFKPLVLVGK